MQLLTMLFIYTVFASVLFLLLSSLTKLNAKDEDKIIISYTSGFLLALIFAILKMI